MEIHRDMTDSGTSSISVLIMCCKLVAHAVARNLVSHVPAMIGSLYLTYPRAYSSTRFTEDPKGDRRHEQVN